MSESDRHRRKRVYMRSIRRGIKEMDVILTRYCDARLAILDEAALTQYEALLDENDHDLYQWISGQAPAPEAFASAISDVTRYGTRL